METIQDDISTWEGEGGSVSEALVTLSLGGPMCAERSSANVNARFDRVSSALQALALKQPNHARLRLFAIMLILEERRGEMLLGDCFIHDWQQRAAKLGQRFKASRQC